jgi:hypothetical protein
MKKIVRAVGPFVNNLRRYSAPSVALYDAVRATLVGWFSVFESKSVGEGTSEGAAPASTTFKVALEETSDGS